MLSKDCKCFQLTGRVEEKRRWSEGVHQAVEAKEGLEIQVCHTASQVLVKAMPQKLHAHETKLFDVGWFNCCGPNNLSVAL